METLKLMTDDELVHLYSNEDNNTAFDVLLKRHQQYIYNYIYFKVRDNQVTEDIFQESFIKAIVSIQRGAYLPSGKFRGWLARIAHNLTIDYFRQIKNENTFSNDDTEIDLLNDKTLCDGTIEDELIAMQITSDVRVLISHLPDVQKEVLVMRYYKDLSFKEIADLTGVSINTALGRMRYAIINMRRMAEENNIALTV